jgi:hypothetical protein
VHAVIRPALHALKHHDQPNPQRGARARTWGCPSQIFGSSLSPDSLPIWETQIQCSRACLLVSELYRHICVSYIANLHGDLANVVSVSTWGAAS